MTDLWPRLEPLLAAAERPARYLNHEFGCVYTVSYTHLTLPTIA